MIFTIFDCFRQVFTSVEGRWEARNDGGSGITDRYNDQYRYVHTSFHQIDRAQRVGDRGGGVGACDCDLTYGESDFLNRRVECEIRI